MQEANLSDPVHGLAGRHPSAIAVITDGSSVNFQDLNALVWKAAGLLRQAGPETVTAGIRFKDQFLHLVFVLGAFRCGLANISLVHNWPDTLNNDLAKQTAAGILFADTPWPGAGGTLHSVSLASLAGDADPADATAKLR